MSSKKKISIILLIAILILSIVCVNIINALSVTSATIKSNGDRGGKTYTLTTTGEVITLQDRVVMNKNVFCVEHGVDIDYYDDGADYRVKGVQEVTDPALAYILTYGNSTGVSAVDSKFYAGDTQIALWMYLYNYKSSTQAQAILGAKTSKYPDKKEFYSADYAAAEELYEDAIEYAENVTDASIKMSNLTKSGNVASFVVSGNYDKFEVYKKEVTDSDFIKYGSTHNTSETEDVSVTCSSSLTKIKVKGYKKMPKVEFRVLECCDAKYSQRLIAITKNTETKNASDDDAVDEFVNSVDVSLQKYVVKVNGHNITSSNTDLTSRENTYASTDTTKKFNNKKIHSGQNATASYKYDNPVKIEFGDSVTYRISVYNNGTTDAIVTIKDWMSAYEEEAGSTTVKKSYGTFEGTIEPASGTPAPTNITFGDRVVRWDVSIPKNKSYYYYVTIKFDKKYTINRLANTATIEPKNGVEIATKYRTEDKDYIRMRQYSVSLEKFVSKVQNSSGVVKFDYANIRAGYRYNDETIVNSEEQDALSGDRTNRKLYKTTNKVLVEKNDKVIFTIRIKNTGNNPLKVTEIYDRFTCYSETGDPKKGMKLEFDTTYGIKKSNGSAYAYSIANYHYGKDAGDAEKKWDQYLIEFTNAATINPGDTFDITMRYTVKMPTGISTGQLMNRAKIAKIVNASGDEVLDNDGPNNNCDKDWVDVGEINYSAAVEKYITKINDSNITNANTTLITREGHPTYTGCATQNDKKDAKVSVFQGDKIEFTIKIINTGEASIKNIRVTDYAVSAYFEFVTCNNVRYAGAYNNEDEFLFQDEIPSGQSRTFTVTYLIRDEHLATAISNAVTIREICNEYGATVVDKDGTNNNRDEDWMSISSSNNGVSLEKYVTHVDAIEIISSNSANYTALYPRENHRDDRDTTKKENPVSVQKGGKVTYTIKITNTGNQPIRDIEVIDTSHSKITHSGNTVNTFIYTSEIAPGNSGYIVKEYIIDANAPQNTKLENKAIINSFKSSSGTIISLDQDSDGTENNVDYDWVIVASEEYDLRVQKYVVSVNGNTSLSPSTNRKDHPIYNKNGFDKEDSNNDVIVNTGDKVRYNIYINNDSTKPVEKIRIKDTFNKDQLKFLNYVPTNGFDIDSTTDGEITFITKNTLDNGTGVLLAVEFEVLASSGRMKNEVNIVSYMDGIYTSDKTPGNDTDLDWIKIQGSTNPNVSLSLEKYIIDVKGKVLNNLSNWNGSREYFPVYRPGLETIKYDNKVKVENGDVVRYQIKITNTGSDVVKNIKIKDTHTQSSELIYENCETDKVSTNDGGKTFVLNSNQEIKPGTENPFYFWVEYKVNKTTAGTIENHAEIDTTYGDAQYDSNTNDNRDKDYVEIEGTTPPPSVSYSVGIEKYVSALADSTGADKSLDPITPRIGKARDNWKNSNPVKVKTGDYIEYSIRIFNHTLFEDVKDVVVLDNYPSSLTYLGCSDPNVAVNGKLFTYNGTISQQSEVTFQVYFQVSATASGKIENPVSINNAAALGDTDTSDNYDSDYIVIEGTTPPPSSVSVALEKYVSRLSDGTNIKSLNPNIQREGNPTRKNTDKVDNPVKVTTNDIVEYAIKLINNSTTQSVSNLIIYDSYDSSELEYVDYSGYYVQALATDGSQFKYTGTISPNSSATFYVYFEVKASSATSSIMNLAFIDNGPALGDSDTSDDTDGDFIELEEKTVSVSLEKYVTKVGTGTISGREGYPIYTHPSSKSSSPVMVEVGDTVTYTIKITNTGDDLIYGITINDPTPSGLQYVSGNYTYSGTIPVGESRYLELKYTVTGNPGDTIVNTATISTPPSGDNTGDNTDSDWIKVKKYQVSLKKYITEVDVSSTIIYSPNITIANTDLIARESNPAYPGSATQYAKRDKPVYADIGSTIRFTFKITNTGTNSNEYGDIKNIVIQENPDSGLEYANNCSVNLERSGNEFKYKHEIEPGKDNNSGLVGALNYIYIDYKIKDTVNVDTLLQNTAKIVSMQNKNGKEVISYDSDGTNNNEDSDWVKTKKYGVSIEKYVNKVHMSNGTELTPLEPNQVRANHPIYAQNGFDKENNPVMVEIGDKVEFIIKVTNTGSGKEYGDIKNISIKDEFGSGLGFDSCEVSATNISGGRQLTYTNPIVVGANVTFKITFLVKDDATLGEKFRNYVIIDSIANKFGVNVPDSDALGSDNNEDADWVQTKKYSVSIEKYVHAVGTKTGPALNPSDTRIGHPIYAQNGFDKEMNPVLVEKGEAVTYKLILRNTGADTTYYGNIKTIKINDPVPTYMNYTNCKIDAGHGDDVEFNNGTIIWNGDLQVGHYIEIQLIYTVKSGAAAPQGEVIENIASIDTLYNRNDKPVNDCDDPDPTDNIDKDWIRIKYTAVGLEKYITKVTSQPTYTDREGKRYNKYFSDAEVDEDMPTSKKDVCKVDWKNLVDNVVKVEPGDIVTFTIKLENTGELPAKITQIYDKTEEFGDAKLELKAVRKGSVYIANATYNNADGYIDITWNSALPAGLDAKIELDFEVVTNIRGKVALNNTAGIREVEDKYGDKFVWNDPPAIEDEEGVDFDGPNNNYDMDFVEVQEYKVSLQKVVASGGVNTLENRWDSWESHANTCSCAKSGQACKDANHDSKCDVCNEFATYLKTVYPTNLAADQIMTTIAEYYKHSDEQVNLNNVYDKHNNPVMVGKSEFVTYEIKVTNNHETKVKPTKIVEILPNGVKLVKVEGPSGEITTTPSSTGHYTYDPSNSKIEIMPNESTLLGPNESFTYKVTVEVTESVMSLDVMKNEAELVSITNKNDYDTVHDVTLGDNQDADYIQMKDVEISGIVWNDRAFDKATKVYDGKYDASNENVLEGITVKLYRDGITDAIAKVITNAEGKYKFTSTDIKNAGVITDPCDIYIKAPFKCEESPYTSAAHKANYWDKDASYNKYFVVFEYDGITYTSTTYTEFGSADDNELTSNAREKLDAVDFAEAKVEKNRTEFNNQYETIDTNGAHASGSTIGLEYDTVNENGYIPKSVYKYDENASNTRMQSSTKKIILTDSEDIEKQIEHVNIGLRGRDIFDLELTSEVARVEVKVHGQIGVYIHENMVKIRAADLAIVEDAANTVQGDTRELGAAATRRASGETRIEQNIRETDLDPDPRTVTAGSYDKYEDTDGLQSIHVIYKVSVTNASCTDGMATKLTNYYDKKYDFVGAYSQLDDARARNTNKLNDYTVSGGTNYNAIGIKTDWNEMTQSETKDIYLVYELQADEFSNITDAGLPTYNMTEIIEYKTKSANGQTEFTRGLIDKDSAPGSANKEQVRTIDTEGQNTPTTGGNPTTVEYYFNTSSDLTKLKYEDDTYAAPTIYFRSKDSLRYIEGIVFEDKTEIEPTTKIKTGNGKLESDEVGVYGATVQLVELDGDKIRYEVETDENGHFEIKGFLPGEYIIRYRYGNTDKTVVIGNNAKSYNGEDFQSTNNSHPISGLSEPVNILTNRTNKFWYLFNEGEGISTATDDSGRRTQVSSNVTLFNDEQMEVLNKLRDGINSPDVTYTDNAGNSVTISVGDFSDPGTSPNIIPQTHMWAETPNMLFTVEKTELVDDSANPGSKTAAEKTSFGEYRITDMNFGIAEVPVTEFKLEKHVKGFIVRDAVGENVLVKCEITRDADNNITGFDTVGDVLPSTDGYLAQIENDKLQGAKLEVTYTISVKVDPQANFDNTFIMPKITGVADFISNNLSYNEELKITKSDGTPNGENREYWEVVRYDDLKDAFGYQKYYDGVTPPEGTVDRDGTKHTTVVVATANNPLIGLEIGSAKAEITLERVLSSTESSIETIMNSVMDSSEYGNIVEIIGFEYESVTSTTPGGSGTEQTTGNPSVSPHPTDNNWVKPKALPGAKYVYDSNLGDGITPAPPIDPLAPPIMRDRVRTPERYIVIPGVQHDNTDAEIIAITDPTGTTQLDTMYYIVAVISLGILALGVFGIKKYVIKK